MSASVSESVVVQQSAAADTKSTSTPLTDSVVVIKNADFYQKIFAKARGAVVDQNATPYKAVTINQSAAATTAAVLQEGILNDPDMMTLLKSLKTVKNEKEFEQVR